MRINIVLFKYNNVIQIYHLKNWLIHSRCRLLTGLHSPEFRSAWRISSSPTFSDRLGSVNSVNREGIYSKEAGQDRSLLCIEQLRACNETAVNKLNGKIKCAQISVFGELCTEISAITVCFNVLCINTARPIAHAVFEWIGI